MTAGESFSVHGCADIKHNSFQLLTAGSTATEEILTKGLLKECKEQTVFIESNCQSDCIVKALEGMGTLAFFFGPELTDTRLSNVMSFPSPAASIGFAYQKQSEFAQLFDHHLLKMVQSGVIKRAYEKWIGSYRDLRDSEGLGEENFKPVLLDQLLGPFLVVASGLFCSVAAAAAEKVRQLFKEN